MMPMSGPGFATVTPLPDDPVTPEEQAGKARRDALAAAVRSKDHSAEAGMMPGGCSELVPPAAEPDRTRGQLPGGGIAQMTGPGFVTLPPPEDDR